MKNKVVYSCITGGYDDIPVHKYISNEWDYILFTDNADLIRAGTFAHWTIKPLQFDKLTNVKNARWHKINPHILFPDYDYSLWLDSTIIINNENIFILMDNLIKKDVLIASPNHPDRKCIYDEAVVIKNQNIDLPKIVDKEMKVLSRNHYPKNNGLTETNIMFRQHNKIKPTLCLWWKMLKKYSKRDQLSFNYALWKTGIKITPIYTNDQGYGIHHFIDDITLIHNKKHNRYRQLNLDVCKEKLCEWYKQRTKKDLNLDTPKTYNEKLQWLKLYDSRPIKTNLSDKFLVRKRIAKKIGKQYLIPLFGVYNSFNEIDFDKLPDKFVIKCNHGSGYNIIVTDKSKLDIKETKQQIDAWMSENFAFRNGMELHYANIKPKIIIEEYISPETSKNEIQLWTFNGKIKFISVESNKTSDDLYRGLFYPDGTPCEFEISPKHYNKMNKIPNIKSFNSALKIGKKLLIKTPYLRIDFIDINNTVKFREFTFTSGSGLSEIVPSEYNNILGDMIKLPNKYYDIETNKYISFTRNKDINLYVLKYHRNINKIAFYIFGIEIFKIKTSQNTKKLYLFGIQFYRYRI